MRPAFFSRLSLFHYLSIISPGKKLPGHFRLEGRIYAFLSLCPPRKLYSYFIDRKGGMQTKKPAGESRPAQTVSDKKHLCIEQQNKPCLKNHTLYRSPLPRRAMPAQGQIDHSKQSCRLLQTAGPPVKNTPNAAVCTKHETKRALTCRKNQKYHSSKPNLSPNIRHRGQNAAKSFTAPLPPAPPRSPPAPPDISAEYCCAEAHGFRR